MYQFDHIGIPTDRSQPNEIYEPAFGLYRTNAADSLLHIEYLRYVADKPCIPAEMRTTPHVGYYVNSLAAAMADMDQILFGPFDNGRERLAYGSRDSMLFELIEKYA